MHDQTAPSHLLDLIFGQAVGQVSSISPRLALWAAAFDAWLAAILAASGRHPYLQALRSWGSLLSFHRCPPWAIDRSKLESWTASLARSGHTANTIRHYQGRISGFFRFCSKQPQLLAAETIFGPSHKPFNPLYGAPKPSKLNYQKAYILHPSEALALLRVVDRHTSLVGKRDYALLLTLLLTALPAGQLRQLRWQHFEVTPQLVRLTSSALTAKEIPPPAWSAILDYLHSSGRYASIQPADYIFTPLADPLLRSTSGQPADWHADRPLSSEQMYASLKAYAAWAGLDASKVTFACLRHTAAALHLQTGAGAPGLQRFLDRQYLKETRRYIGHLGRMLGGHKPRSTRRPIRPYQRRSPHAQLGNQNAFKHGFYSHHLPQVDPADGQEAAAATLESEVVALRVLMRRAMESFDRMDNLPDAMRLLEAFGLTSMRVARLLLKRHQMQPDPSDLAFEQALLKLLDDLGMPEQEA